MKMKMKTRVYSMLAVVVTLLFAQIACGLPANTSKATPTLPPAVIEPTNEAVQPTEEAAQPTLEAVVSTPEAAQPTEASSTDACSTSGSSTPKPSGLITTVTLALGTEGAQKDAANPTTVFQSKDIIHAVVTIQDAPAASAFKAVWYATDVGSAAPCNTEITSTDLTTDGSRNIDFSLTPEKSWPAGSYRAEIFVNTVLDQVVFFKVQ
jgi:hypothetical protein